jgi:hypothetical protein
MKKLLIVCLSVFLLIPVGTRAQEISKEVRYRIGDYLTQFVAKDIKTAPVAIDTVIVAGNAVKIFAGENLAYVPLSRSDVSDIYAHVRGLLPEKYKKYRVVITSDTQPLENLVAFSQKKKDLFANKLDKPLVSNLSRPYSAERGLDGHHLVIWQSHGWYYEQKLSRWEWQRARLFQTVEDLYTQSYVLPYLVPMLENAGANVLVPRERDASRHEVIIDNEGSTTGSAYIEKSGKEHWTTGEGSGFANTKAFYLDGENPFTMGTYRQIKTTANGEESVCEWVPDIPQKGKYAVYVSYWTLPKSTDDARYTVYHAGGKTELSVNQKMGGGTWIFLGFFEFDEGKNDNCKITLSNRSDKSGRILTADAVKIGGGMGNIARLPHPSGLVTPNTKSSVAIEADQKQVPVKIDYRAEVSGYPRIKEASRYWLQWAGAPDSIYNKSGSKNDYTDDYQSRGAWVNYIAGGSSAIPDARGLNIPIDLAMAFHSDAGTTLNDSIIGSLGIYLTHTNGGKFANGKSRWASRDLTEAIMNEIVTDVRRQYEPNWTRRAIWNSSYNEARTPQVPSMLLELLSHQNFADMRYGLDPRFRFTVSRAVYKGMLKFVAAQYGFDYVVQPLPVRSFSAEFSGEGSVRLRWSPTEDSAEPTAVPTSYVVYTRRGEGGFDNGQVVRGTSVELPITKDCIYSFRIAALNEGGESFPSEILSVCRKSDERGQVLIVNGFDRISAPLSFDTEAGLAGFVDAQDHGVPDGVEHHYIGSQYDFQRERPWLDDDATGFGASNANYESSSVAGNTFDYPLTHGSSIASAGYSFVSASRDAVVRGDVELGAYDAVDLILGKQRQTKIGRGVHPAEFKTFPAGLQQKIADYCSRGGNIFVSGAYVGSDLWEAEEPLDADKQFATDVLKYTLRTGHAAVTGKARAVASPFPVFNGDVEFHTKLNPEWYAVESPDAIEPAGEGAYTQFRYSENNLSAGIVYEGAYRTCVLGFPFEVIKERKQRDILMASILSFLSKK